MKVFCRKTYISKKTKEILYTIKKSYDSFFPSSEFEKDIIYVWILDNNNEREFFSKKEFSKYFEEIDRRRDKIIDELLD